MPRIIDTIQKYFLSAVLKKYFWSTLYFHLGERTSELDVNSAFKYFWFAPFSPALGRKGRDWEGHGAFARVFYQTCDNTASRE